MSSTSWWIRARHMSSFSPDLSIASSLTEARAWFCLISPSTFCYHPRDQNISIDFHTVVWCGWAKNSFPDLSLSLLDWKLSDASQLLYEADKPADYFILILEGHVQTVAGGREQFQFDRGPFHSFGVDALRDVNFVPDYTVQPSTDILYLRVSGLLCLC